MGKKYQIGGEKTSQVAELSVLGYNLISVLNKRLGKLR
jgi:hypothetical protein